MKIRDASIHSSQADSLRSGSVANTSKAEATDSGRNQAARPSSPQQDRVEISDAARTAAQAQKTEGIDFARKALLGIPPLSEQRSADMLKRIQEGYYSQPEVLAKVAEKIATDLKPNSGSDL